MLLINTFINICLNKYLYKCLLEPYIIWFATCGLMIYLYKLFLNRFCIQIHNLITICHYDDYWSLSLPSLWDCPQRFIYLIPTFISNDRIPWIQEIHNYIMEIHYTNDDQKCYLQKNDERITETSDLVMETPNPLINIRWRLDVHWWKYWY